MPACYLIVQNGNSRKTIIAGSKTYIASQTRRQEIQQQQDLDGFQKRAASLFISVLSKDKIDRESISGIDKANLAQREIGKMVIQTIRDLGGTMPEDLPTPVKSCTKKPLNSGKIELSD